MPRNKTPRAKGAEAKGQEPAGEAAAAAAADDTSARKRKAEEAAPSAPAEEVKDEGADSETEYPSCDLSACPGEIVVKYSGHTKVDGRYTRLNKASRGRPCYSMARDGKKSVYLFWYKNSKWHISFDLGGSKSLARVEDGRNTEYRLPPCEPHPHCWKVLQTDGNNNKKDKTEMTKEEVKASKTYKTIMPMRVIDAALLDEAAERELGLEPDAVRKRPRVEAKPSEEKTAGAAGTDAAAKDSSAAAAPEDDEAAAAEAAAQDSDEESSDEDSDDSDSGASSSSASPSAAVKAKAAQVRHLGGDQLDANEAKQEAEDRQKREAFERKLRSQLQSVSEPKTRQNKLQQVKQMLTDKKEQMVQRYGLREEHIKALVAQLDAEFGAKSPTASAAAAAAPAAAQGRPAAELTSRTALRKRDMPYRFKVGRTPRITWPGARAGELPQLSQFTQYTTIQSHKALGQELWFQMPGAYVACDGCSRTLPQSMGALCGEGDNRPSFANSQWFCSDCLASHQQQQVQQQVYGYQTPSARYAQ